MKTIQEWLTELPEPYRTEALTNAEKDVLDKPVENLYDALRFAFIWVKSPQGGCYWSEVSQNLDSLSPDTIEYELRQIAKLLVDIGTHAYEYLRGNVTHKEFAKWLEIIGDTYSLKV